MDLSRIILRMALWIRRPPSAQRIVVIGAVILIALIVVAIEKAGYWPDALTVDSPKRFRLHRF